MPPVFTSVEIGAFRGLRELRLEALGRANVLLGVNDCGKTSVLEALVLLTDPASPYMWTRLSHVREPPNVIGVGRLLRAERVRWLFPTEAGGRVGSMRVSATCGGSRGADGTPDLNVAEPTQTAFEASYAKVTALRPEPVRTGRDQAEAQMDGAEVSVVVTGLGARAEKITVWDRDMVRHPRGPAALPAAELVMAYDHWVSSPAKRFSHSRLEGQSSELVGLLKGIDREIEGLEIHESGGDFTLYVSHATSGLVPLSVFGDGVRRSVLLADRVLRAKGGLLLIDEIETGIHVDAITGVFRWLLDACRQYDVQLFVTTHSLEAVDAMLKADTTTEEDVVGFRLFRESGRTSAKRYGEKQLRWMREERGLDVRK